MIGDSNDKTKFPHELLLTDRQVSSICRAFANNSSDNIKFLKTQLSQMIHSGELLGKLLGPLLKTGLPLIKNVITTLVKSVLVPLGLTASASAEDAVIYKKILGSGNTTTLIISKTVYLNFLEHSGLILEEVTESVQNEVKVQKGGFLIMLLGTLGASLLGNLLSKKGLYRAGNGKSKGINRTGEEPVKVVLWIFNADSSFNKF